MNLLYWPFRVLVERGLRKAKEAGLVAYVFESFRTQERQQRLYNQGRAHPGFVVTSAKPGLSWHNYGLAVDIVFDGSAAPGIQWSWDGDYVGSKQKDYIIVAQVLKQCGLEWLGDSKKFREMPHFQRTWGLTIFEAKILYDRYGLEGVWYELDRRLVNG